MDKCGWTCLCYLVLCLWWGSALHGQDTWRLRLQLQPQDKATFKKAERLADTYADSAAVRPALQTLLRQLRAASFLEASVDSLVLTDSTYTAHLWIGPPYQWMALDVTQVPEEWLDAVNFRTKAYLGKSANLERIKVLQERLLRTAQENGYPFAEVGLDSFFLTATGAGGRLFANRGPLIVFDTLAVTGNGRLHKAYLEQYLGIQPGTPYDQKKVLNIRPRLRELTFLTVPQDPGVQFYDQKALVNIPLQKKRASQFDFIIGVLPASPQVDRLLITGTFNAELLNAFGLGERIFAKFEQLRPETQRLDLEFSYPYVLGLPFGTDLAFDLYKRDTTFLDLHFDFGLQYLFEGGNYLQVFWENKRGVLLTIDEAAIVAQQQLPQDLDLRTLSFGLETFLQQLDYRFNPRRGWQLHLRGGAGIRRIQRNNEILDLELGSLYDTLNLRSVQYRLTGEGRYFVPLFSRSALLVKANAGWIIADGDIYRNEQFRLGGNRLMRGFDEEFFFASQYVIGTLEWRFLLAQNSYLYAFYDRGWLTDRTSTNNFIVQPSGLGAGITFETSVGLFGFSLAVGGTQDIPLDFNSPKVHFGYVSRF